MSYIDDLLDQLFNPFRYGELQNPYVPPPSGTPSLTDPGTYTPTEPGSGPGPYDPFTPPDVISGTGGGGTGGGNTGGGGSTGGGSTGGGSTGGGNTGGGGAGGGGTDGGGYGGPYTGPTTSAPGSLSPGGAGTRGDYYKIVDGKVVRYTLESIRGLDEAPPQSAINKSPVSGFFVAGETVVGDAGDEAFTIEGSSGQYGEGVYYKDGRLYSYASPETLANIRAAGNTPHGIDPNLMTEAEKARYRMQTGRNPSAGYLGMSDYGSVGGRSQPYASGAYGAGQRVTPEAITTEAGAGADNGSSTPGGVSPIVAALYGDPTKGKPVDTPYEGSFEYYRDQREAAARNAESAAPSSAQQSTAPSSAQQSSDANTRAAIEQLRRMGLSFRNGGSVTSGIGGLFRREVMR